MTSTSVFDSHLHIIDPSFPLIENQGFVPAPYTVQDYLSQMSNEPLIGGAVVSGSFQAYDQSYLISALKQLGKGFVGVTQIPLDTSDEEIIYLDQAGVRAVRFNLKRGGSEDIQFLQQMAKRVYDLVGWHIELYIDSKDLSGLMPVLPSLPKVSIDHLGLSQAGLSNLYHLVEQGVYVKATGFSRSDFDVVPVMKQIFQINDQALMFGTDLPSTRAPKTYSSADKELLEQSFSQVALDKIMSQNALSFYRVN